MDHLQRDIPTIIPKKNQRRFFEAAQKISFQGIHRCQIGSVIVHENKIISAGCNQKFIFDNLTRQFNPLKALHAEISAVLKTKNKQILKHCDLYVYRQNKEGSLAMCRPCPCCTRIISMFGLTSVYYTSEKGYHHENLNR